MPTEQTYSLWKGKGGSEFQRVREVTATDANPFVRKCFHVMDANSDLYDIAWKFLSGDVFVIRRDGAQRGGEE